jgi:hypothetical protein
LTSIAYQIANFPHPTEPLKLSYRRAIAPAILTGNCHLRRLASLPSLLRSGATRR